MNPEGLEIKGIDDEGFYSAWADEVIRGPDRDVSAPWGAKALCGGPLVHPPTEKKNVSADVVCYTKTAGIWDEHDYQQIDEA